MLLLKRTQVIPFSSNNIKTLLYNHSHDIMFDRAEHTHEGQFCVSSVRAFTNVSGGSKLGEISLPLSHKYGREIEG